MQIIAVDDEEFALSVLIEEIKSASPSAKVNGFLFSKDALEFAKNNPCDVAFIDIEMPQINGISLAKKLKKINPKINLIFVTAYKDYSINAFQVHASGYLLKPVTKKAILNELDNLRYSIDYTNIPSGISVVTFGNFDILVDGISVHFGRSKSKELLAYLVHRKGTGITKREIASVLFEDKGYNYNIQDYINKITRDMEFSLKKANADGILIKKRNYYAINPESFQCDLYDYEKGNPIAISKFCGEYMSQYSWGENTLANLLKEEK